jgi:putative tricarboxylic transport membrane protein
MSEDRQGPAEDRAAFGQKTAELVVAALFLAVGAIVMWDSARLGSTWAEDGPRPGYFPFYVGLLIIVSAVFNIIRALAVPKAKDKAFVERGQLKLVLSVLVPTALYATAVTWIGIYVASIVFIGFFMRWLGKYPWWKVVLVSFAAITVFYLIFEVWFLVPLPKGPVESWVGLN